MSVLRTPEQVAKDLGDGIISPHMIRRLIREQKIAYTELSRSKFAMSESQVQGMLDYLTRAPVAESKRVRAARESAFKSPRK